ncbi:MAG: hypothetical protein ACK5Q5_12645 [Planctomycetaceae bacterium]
MTHILIFVAVWFASSQCQIAGRLVLAADRPEIAELPMQPRTFSQAPDPDELWVRSIEDWHAVRPHWLVGILHEGPAATGTPLAPDEMDESRHVGVVAVNVNDGKAKWLRPNYRGQFLDSVVPLGDHRCGFTLKRQRKGTERQQQQYQLREWNLLTDEVGDARDWHPLMGPVARVVDTSRLTLEWQSGSAVEPGSAKVELQLADGSRVAVPAPLKDYSLPLEMSTLWEEGQETRWYAPTEDGIGVISFVGQRSREEKWREPYSASSTVTCYDPRVDGGVRWTLSLKDLIGQDNREVHSVIPVFSPWTYQRNLLIECIGKGSDDTGPKKANPVRIVQVNLRDGSIQQSVGFDASERFRFLVRSWWPRCSTDQTRVIYMVQDGRSRPCRLAAYSVSEQRFLDDVTCPLPFAEHLLPVSPAEEAIVLDQWQMSAVGIGEANYGQVRKVHRLFATDIEPEPADSPRKK